MTRIEAIDQMNDAIHAFDAIMAMLMSGETLEVERPALLHLLSLVRREFNEIRCHL